jgi:hypothetical protein
MAEYRDLWNVSTIEEAWLFKKRKDTAMTEFSDEDCISCVAFLLDDTVSEWLKVVTAGITSTGT